MFSNTKSVTLFSREISRDHYGNADADSPEIQHRCLHNISMYCTNYVYFIMVVPVL